MKTVAIVSANFGEIDYFHRHVEQDYAHDRASFCEYNSPYPFPNLDNRTKSKFFKMQMHTLLEHDAFIWSDASVEITDPTFVSTITRYLESYDMVNFTHPQRKSVYAEIDYMIYEMTKGSHYLISRYGHQRLGLEKQF